MNFFDKKEDVLELELTPHGRNKLAKGEFRPTYYAFFDDDIIYDVEHMGLEETQNASQKRILESIVTKPFVSFSNRQSGSLDIAQYDQHYAYFSHLGTTKEVQEEPGWEIRFLEGKISSSADFLTGALGDIRIPQIELEDLFIKTKVVFPSQLENPEFPEFHGELSENCEQEEEFQFEDGSEYELEVEPLILELYENNVKIDKSNFTIELFEVEGDRLKQLRFFKEPQRIVNDILLDDDEIEEIDVESIENTDVEYYFDIEVDDEIDSPMIDERMSGKDRYNNSTTSKKSKETKNNNKFPDIYVFDELEEDDECQQ